MQLDFVVWPPLDSIQSDEAMQCLAIMSWYAGPIARSILIPVWDDSGTLPAIPSYASIASLLDFDKVRFVPVIDAISKVQAGCVTLLVRSKNVENDVPPLSAAAMPGSQRLPNYDKQTNQTTTKYYYIGMPDIDTQDAYYACCLTYWAVGAEDKSFLMASYNKLLEIKAEASTREAVSIFGTGPSLEESLEVDHSRSLNIICNTIVKNRSFLERLQPKIIVAADAHFHFSYHRYSARFLSDVAFFLQNSDAIFFTFDKFAAFIRYRLPSVADRVFGIPAGRTEYGHDLDREFRVFPGDSVLNMFLLPLASFLSDTVFLHGFTGRSAADKYFWSHSDLHQYSELMEDVRLAHPAFFRDRDYVGYADTVDRDVRLRVDYARAAGKTISSKTTSFYTSFSK